MTSAATIRPEAAGDHPSIDRVVAAAFGSADEARLVRDLRDSAGYRPELTFVAVVDGEVVGHVMISDASVMISDVSVRRDTGGLARVAMLSPLAVDPAHQRAGVGADLVRAACAAADEAGEAMVVLQGDPAYYGRFGFEPSAPCDITMDLPDWAPPEAAQLLRLPAWDGSVTGHLVLPAAFDGLE